MKLIGAFGGLCAAVSSVIHMDDGTGATWLCVALLLALYVRGED